MHGLADKQFKIGQNISSVPLPNFRHGRDFYIEMAMTDQHNCWKNEVETKKNINFASLIFRQMNRY